MASMDGTITVKLTSDDFAREASRQVADLRKLLAFTEADNTQLRRLLSGTDKAEAVSLMDEIEHLKNDLKVAREEARILSAHLDELRALVDRGMAENREQAREIVRLRLNQKGGWLWKGRHHEGQ